MFELLLSTIKKNANPSDILPIPDPDILGYAKAVLASDDGKSIYIAGGNIKTGITRKVYRYDIASRTWTRLADLPTAIANVNYGNMAQIGNLLYYIRSRDIYTYNIDTDTWALKLTLPTTSPMRMYGSGLHVFNGLIYTVRYSEGDYDAGTRLVEYNPTTNAVRAVNKYTSGLPAYLGGAVLNGKLYMTTGSPRTTGMLSVCDLTTFVWTDIPSTFVFDAIAASVAHDNKIYMFADNYGTPVAYAPADNSYKNQEPLKFNFTSNNQAVGADGKAYILTPDTFISYEL